MNNIRKTSKNNNIIFQSLTSSLSETPLNQNVFYQKLHDYSKLNNEGSLLIINNKFPEALEKYEKSLELSSKMKDDLKKNESKCNIGISYFYLGQMNESINYIHQCYDYIYSLCSIEAGNNNIKNLYLLCKSGANLCMCLLTINTQNDNSLKIINNIIKLISNEEDINKQIICITYLNNILFRVNSLTNDHIKLSNNNILNYNNDEKFNNNLANVNEEQHQKINKLFTESFDNFIATQKLEPWIKSLNKLSKLINESNDNSGLIYIIFNKQMAICLKNDSEFNQNQSNSSNNKEINEAKIKLISLLQDINKENSNDKNNKNGNIGYKINMEEENNEIDEEYINILIEDYKLKISLIRKIYQILYSFEKKLNSNLLEVENDNNNFIYQSNNKSQNNDNFVINVNNEIYLILLLKYAINYFNQNIKDNQLKNNLIKDVNNTLDLIYAKKIDLSKLNLSLLEPQISQSLISLLKELFYIYRKKKLKKYFRKFKLKTKKNKKKTNDKILDNFFETFYLFIYRGEIIRKINFHSTRTKDHFYQIDNENDLFESFHKDGKSKKPIKVYDFDDILKVVVGFKTKNIIKKVNKLDNIQKKDKPYYFLSLVLRRRTIDLYFSKEESAKNWFYGLFHYFNISGRSYKINSCTNYILFRLKCKMINKLEENIKNINDLKFSSCIIQYFKRDSNSSDD